MSSHKAQKLRRDVASRMPLAFHKPAPANRLPENSPLRMRPEDHTRLKMLKKQPTPAAPARSVTPVRTSPRPSFRNIA